MGKHSLDQWGFRFQRAMLKSLGLIGLAPDFAKSAAGPYLETSLHDRTFWMSLKGYSGFLTRIIRAQQKPFVFLDIGANAGLFSLVAAGQPMCRSIFAFEPIPATFDKLRRNIARNQAEHVHPVGGAIADGTADTLQMAYSSLHSGKSSIVEETAARTVEVPRIGAEQLSALLAGKTNRLFIKIDVEGAEASVLRVLRQTNFFDQIEDIVIELSLQTQSSEARSDVIALLIEYGFEEMARHGGSRHYDAHYHRDVTPPLPSRSATFTADLMAGV